MNVQKMKLKMKEEIDTGKIKQIKSLERKLKMNEK